MRIITLLIALMSFVTAWGQMPQPMPIDPAIRYGKLPNGLTYYIAHNELPEQHAEFYIAQRVGSVLEEESQRGLAHFLEHMAFNGTKNFPGKNMLEYLQRNGVKFGTNVNAYTSIDETVYNISDVPTDETHPGIIDSCLLMLHDWSGFISLEDEEIDNERGVIHEEWRTRNSAMLRLYEHQILPKLIPGNRYAYRMPIGLMSVVDSFTYDELRNYYHKWYRPDLQGIMVVGDVNVDEVEQKIKTLWQDIETPADAPVREYFQVEDNVEPLVCVATDPELTSNQISIMYKSEKMPEALQESVIGILNSWMERIITNAIDMRLYEVSQQADAPFQGAGVGFDDYLIANTKECFSIGINVKPGKWQEGLNAAMAVVKSAVQHGLTFSEVERAKAEIQSDMENAYNERDKRKNGQIIASMKAHFLNHYPLASIETRYQLMPQLLQALTVEQINQALSQAITEQNVAMYFVGQQKDDNPMPTEAELLAAYQQAAAQEVEAYAEEAVAQTLIAKLPKPGKIKKVAEGPFGATEWTLSNGVRVLWKTTDFKKDNILMSAQSDGGTLLTPNEDYATLSMISDLYELGGLADFNDIALSKALSGKKASTSVSIGRTGESVSGSATPKDFRTMMELTYLSFTAPRKDQEAYDAWYARRINAMKNQLGTPNKIINDSLIHTLYKGSKVVRPLTLEDMETLSYDRALELGKARLANAADFTFYFIGNIDEDSLRTLCCQYLATLPANKKQHDVKPASVLYTRGTRANRFDVPMEQPKTTVYNIFSLYDQPWTLKEDIATTMLGQVLSIVFTETIREKEGGVYSPGASASFDDEDGMITLLYRFDTGADKCAHIEEVAFQEFSKLAAPGGIPTDAFEKTRDYMAKRYQEQQRENGYWLSQIRSVDHFQHDFWTGYQETLQSITPADLESIVARLLKADHIQFVANGVEK